MAWKNYATIVWREGFCHNKMCDHSQQYIERDLVFDKPVAVCGKCGFNTIYAMPRVTPEMINAIKVELQKHGLLNLGLTKPTQGGD